MHRSWSWPSGTGRARSPASTADLSVSCGPSTALTSTCCHGWVDRRACTPRETEFLGTGAGVGRRVRSAAAQMAAQGRAVTREFVGSAAQRCVLVLNPRYQVRVFLAPLA